jgi:hypothetical protein
MHTYTNLYCILGRKFPAYFILRDEKNFPADYFPQVVDIYIHICIHALFVWKHILCMHVYVYICIFCTYICLNISIYIHISVYTHILAYLILEFPLQTTSLMWWIYIHVYIYINILIYIYVCVRVYLHVHIYEYMYIILFTYKCVGYIRIHAHIKSNIYIR